MGELRRDLSGLDATGVVIGAIVGVGIFFTPSRVASLVGDGSTALLVWGLGGLVAMFGALTLAELGGMYPKTGGQYDILRDAYGAATAFVYVVCNATAIQAGAIAIIALVCVQNGVVALLGHSLEATPTTALAVVLVVGLAGANALGVRWGVRIQNITVLAKVGILLCLGGIALAFDTPARTEPEALSGLDVGIFAALVPVLFAFGGWQQALWMAGEVRRPTRNVPLAIVVGVGVVVAIYLLTNWAYLALLGHANVASSHTLAADAVGVVFGARGRSLIGIAVAVSAFGVLNAQLLTGPRLVLALAEDGRFFAPFARVHARTATPVPAIAMMATVAVVLLVAAGEKGIDRLLTGVVFVDGIFFALTGLASLVLARKQPRADRPVRMPGWPFVPLIFGLAELGIVVGAWMDPKVRSAAAIGAAWIAAAVVLYLVRFRRRAAATD